MARGVSLGVMVENVRLEAGMTGDPSLGQNYRAAVVRAIQRAQETLSLDYDWPYLKVERDIQMQAGERYYDFPDDLPLENVDTVHFKWGNGWSCPLPNGITLDMYSQVDPDQDERTDPVQAWRAIDTGAALQIEVWPVPASDHPTAGPLRLYGRKILGTLLADADTCDLDSTMIELYAAASLVASRDPERAQELVAAARSRYAAIAKRSAPARRVRSFADGDEPGGTRDVEIRVAYGDAS